MTPGRLTMSATLSRAGGQQRNRVRYGKRTRLSIKLDRTGIMNGSVFLRAHATIEAGRAELSYLGRTRAPHYDRRGNGAGIAPSPNFNRPRSMNTSAAPTTCMCHQRVSVRAGTRPTTTAPPPPRQHTSPPRYRVVAHKVGSRRPGPSRYIRSVVVNGQTNPSFHPRPLSVGRGRTWVQVKPLEHTFQSGYQFRWCLPTVMDRTVAGPVKNPAVAPTGAR